MCLLAGRQLAIKGSLSLKHFQADMEMLFLSNKKKPASQYSKLSQYVYKFDMNINFILMI